MDAEVRVKLGGWAHTWLLAARRQAQRVADSGVGMAPVEMVMFIDALRNVVRAAEKLLGRDHEALRAFRQAVPNAVAVRDMLEHFDAYLEGRGKLQRAGTVDDPWSYFASGSIQNTTRRLHVGGYEIELPGAMEALTTLGLAALEAASITSVSDAPQETGQ
jgi:hypothetical protein